LWLYGLGFRQAATRFKQAATTMERKQIKNVPLIERLGMRDMAVGEKRNVALLSRASSSSCKELLCDRQAASL
jgi:hypothetical protein